MLLEADGLEGVVHSPARHVPYRFDGIFPGSVDDVGRPEFPGEIELGAHGVDGDDAPRARYRGAVDGGESDAAEADHRHRAADLDLGGVVHRADPGGHAATDERSPVERHVLANLHDGVLMHEHVLGKRGEVVELVHQLAVLAEARRLAGGAVHVLGALAVDEMPGDAGFAVTAEDRETGDDMVPRADVPDLVADRLHHSCRLVPEDAGKVSGVESLDNVQIAVTHAGSGDPHQHFVPHRVWPRRLLRW